MKMLFQIMSIECFLKVSNDFEFPMFASRVFHSLSAATE